jgi:hypothetical protein
MYLHTIKLRMNSNDDLLSAKHIDIELVVDESGSMEDRRQIVVNGINEFIQQQKADLCEGTTCSVSLFFFNHCIRNIFENKLLENVQKITLEDYKPSGCTALNDAFGARLSRIQELPVNLDKKRILLVITDGEENSSKHFTTEKLRLLINQTKEKVEIVYMGSNQDAILNGSHYGASRESSLNYSDEFLREALRATTNAVGRIVSGRSSTVEYTQLERDISRGSSQSDTQNW